MGDRHVVRLEPVGIEIEVLEEQTVLRAAAEQGIMLMHGCKEGQCAACKSFVLEGEDIELDTYSTFALPDFELDEGYTLLCRAHVYEDVTIELLNYDEEMIHSGLPIQELRATVVSNDLVTSDLHHLVLQLEEGATFGYFPGQYVDLTAPGTDVTRSFSIANADATTTGRLEFVIKAYPDGSFSKILDAGLHPGSAIDVVGPFGVFTLREGRDCDVVFVGGGAGMAPVLAVLRQLADKGSGRRITFYYGARRRQDLCFETELAELGTRLPAFTYVPALSEPDDEPWAGEVGLITEVLTRREGDLSEVDAYVCGPPRWSRRPFMPSAPWVPSRSASTSTSSPPPERLEAFDRERKVGARDDHHHAAQPSASVVHRRRGRGQGLPGLDLEVLQLLHPGQAQAEPLRGRHRRGPARPAPLPQPGLALRVRRRQRGLPPGVDGAQGVGLGPPCARAVPGVGRQGLRMAGPRVARVP